MEKRKEEKVRKVRRSLRKEESNEINVTPKKISQLESSPDKRHINVLTSKLNNAMARISELEWEKDNLENKVLTLSETLQKQKRSLEHYKSKNLKHDMEIKAIHDQYESDILDKNREIKSMKIQHESDILDKEKIILNQTERISEQASSIEEMNSAREFRENDDNIPKTKAGLLLEMIIFYENLSRVLNNDSSEEDIVKNNEVMAKKINQLINEFKSSPDFKLDITNQVIISQLEDIVDYLTKVSDYVKNKDVLKEGAILVSNDFKEVLASEGVEEIHTYMEKFDPAKHEVVSYEKDENSEDGYIIEEIAKGYAINGKMIKPAKVVVCKK